MLLTIDPDALAIASSEIIVVSCALNVDVSFTAPASIEIDAAGVRGSRTTIEIVAAWDTAQLESRTTNVQCTVTSSVASKQPAPLVIPVEICGIAQPSLALFCTKLSATSCATPAAFSTSLTTNGGNEIIVIGGTCLDCPQPPFEAGTTRVSIAGAVVATTVYADGTRLLFKTPLISTLPGDAELGQYLPLSITTAAGAQGAIEGTVRMGPGAPATQSGGLECAEQGFCPPGRPESSGVMYAEECVGYLNPVDDLRWEHAATNPTVLAEFAYGIPPNCRACPAGCRCPGGDRCRAEPGYFAASESLGRSNGPLVCAAPALSRCKGYDASLGDTRCGAPFTGPGCGLCAKNYFLTHGSCLACPESDAVSNYAGPAVVNAVAYASVFPLTFITKMGFFIASEKFSDRDERMPIREIAKATFLQTAAFVGTTVATIQLVATVSTASTGDRTPLLQYVSTVLEAFLLKPPLVNPACTPEGLPISFLTEYVVLIGSLVLALLGLALSCRWLRPEQLVLGWHCCTSDRVRKARILLRTRITPYLRFAISAALLLLYGRVVPTTLSMMHCRRSQALGDRFALASDASIPCFTSEHMPVLMLSIVTMTVVVLIWPIVTMICTSHIFVIARDDPNPHCTNGAHSHCAMCCIKRLCVVVNSMDEDEDEDKYKNEDEDKDEDDGGDGDQEAKYEDDAGGVSGGKSAAADGVFVRIHANPMHDDADAIDALAAAADGEGGDNEMGFFIASKQFSDDRVWYDLVVELGCCAKIRRATRVAQRAEEKEKRVNAYNSFLSTQFLPQFFWLVAVNPMAVLALNLVDVAFVLPNPTLTSSILLFASTVMIVLLRTIAIVGCCPFHRSDRWLALQALSMFVLCSLQAATNLCLSLGELGFDTASAVDWLAFISAIALPVCLLCILVGFLFSRGLGCCSRVLSRSTLGKAIIAQVDDAAHERQQREEAELNVEDEGGDGDEDHDIDDDEHAIDGRENPIARAATERRAAAAAAVIVGRPLPEGWDAHIVKETGKTYFHHVAASMTQWTFPTEVDCVSAAATVAAAAVIVADDVAPPLPEGWDAHVVHETGKTYFHHVAAGITQWTFPTEADCALVAATVAERVLAAAEAVEMVSSSADLPEGWAAVRHGDGRIYYYNATTGETSWDVPVELRHGWVKLMHEEYGRAYFHHAASGLQSWTSPTDEDDARAREIVATEASAAIKAVEAAKATALWRLNKRARLDAKKKKADRAALSAEAMALRSAKRDAELAAEAARREKLSKGKTKVRWKWSAKMETTLASALLGMMADGGTPEYLRNVFAAIFEDADRDGDGKLSTVELMMMIDRRAKKTALGGNSHAICKLKEVLHKQAEHDEITGIEWERGLVAMMRADESGPVAEWIMHELQTLARQWKEFEHPEDGSLFYSNRKLGVKTWKKPSIVSAMEHFEALRSGALDSSESSNDNSSSSRGSSDESDESGDTGSSDSIDELYANV